VAVYPAGARKATVPADVVHRYASKPPCCLQLPTMLDPSRGGGALMTSQLSAPGSRGKVTTPVSGVQRNADVFCKSEEYPKMTSPSGVMLATVFFAIPGTGWIVVSPDSVLHRKAEKPSRDVQQPWPTNTVPSGVVARIDSCDDSIGSNSKPVLAVQR
jgi:hypothetical protein